MRTAGNGVNARDIKHTPSEDWSLAVPGQDGLPVGWNGEDGPYQSLGGRTPRKVYEAGKVHPFLHSHAANDSGERDPPLTPSVPANLPRLELRISCLAGRRYLPIVELARAAWGASRARRRGGRTPSAWVCARSRSAGTVRAQVGRAMADELEQDAGASLRVEIRLAAGTFTQHKSSELRTSDPLDQDSQVTRHG
jgi:hypothetical protein